MEKICSTCYCTKPLEDFSLQPTGLYGRHATCLECKRADSKARYDYTIDRNRNLKSKYGITLEEYKELLSEQCGLCAICLQPNPIDKVMNVDHDHITQKVRGLLCHKCNTGLGLFNDDINLLTKAIEYIRNSDREAYGAILER